MLQATPPSRSLRRRRVAHGGKGFPGPLPFALGINLDIYGGLATSLTQLAGVGMKYGRIEVPWNYAKGNAPAFESTPGTQGVLRSSLHQRHRHRCSSWPVRRSQLAILLTHEPRK
jgi:hypothetical protein